MAIEVVPLTKSDIPEAVDIILAAFADDPYFKWVFDPNTVSLLYLPSTYLVAIYLLTD